MKWNSELKWNSLLQRRHKVGADKSRWKSFQSGPQFCRCFFSSTLRKIAHLAWKSDGFCPSSPGWFGCLFFTKWKNGGAELWIFLQWPGQGSLHREPSCSEKRAATHLDLHSHPGTNRASTISGMILLTAWHSILKYSVLTHKHHPGPTLQWTALTGIESTALALSAPCSDQHSQPGTKS